MRILVIGAYGLLGGYVTARLLADGYAVRGVGRDVTAAARRFPAAEWKAADLRTTSAGEWRALLEGVDAVVNCAGALQDSPRDDLAAVHERAVAALAQACGEAGVRRVVHISAAGVEDGRGRFRQTKRAAEETLQSTDLEWMILRPGVVLAPAAYGGSALLRGLAGIPGFIPVFAPESVVHTIAVEDLAEAVVRSVRADGPTRFVADVVAGESTTLGDVLVALRAWLGFPPAPLAPAPGWLVRLSATAADALALLGWRSPMRSAALTQLAAGVQGRSEDAERIFGFRPRSLGETLAHWPSGVQERWFARLYFVKPTVLTILALFWGVSGIIGFARYSAAVRLLMDGGLASTMAQGLVTTGSIADLLLASLVCFRRTAPVALKGMLLLTGVYLVGATVWTPHLWADPLGPLIKSVPAAILAVIALAVMDER